MTVVINMHKPYSYSRHNVMVMNVSCLMHTPSSKVLPIRLHKTIFETTCQITLRVLVLCNRLLG